MNKIEEAITDHWGERCPDSEAGCPCCDAWAEYDALAAERDAWQASSGRWQELATERTATIEAAETALATARNDALEEAADIDAALSDPAL